MSSTASPTRSSTPQPLFLPSRSGSGSRLLDSVDSTHSQPEANRVLDSLESAKNFILSRSSDTTRPTVRQWSENSQANWQRPSPSQSIYSSPIHHSLPTLPFSHHKNLRFREDASFDPWSESHSLSHYHPRLDLAAALGEDNIPHTTEIDSIPCAGIRIPHGRLRGLLAWRLVVRLPLGERDKFPTVLEPPFEEPSQEKIRHGRSISADYSLRQSTGSPYSGISGYVRSWVDANSKRLPCERNIEQRKSVLEEYVAALAPDVHLEQADNFSDYDHRSTSSLSVRSRPQDISGVDTTFPTLSLSESLSNSPNSVHEQSPKIKHSTSFIHPTAVVTNFFLDTSLPYSTIPRETLLALGFKIPSENRSRWFKSKPSNSEFRSDILRTGQPVMLRVQGIPTHFLIAPEGDAGRLGVRFIEDAGVNLFVDREVGMPVLYGDRELQIDAKDIPRTVGLKVKKLSMQQRVKAVFGLRKPE